ncbi:hypothetical protein Vsou_11300 [Vulcanisaeta souniana JCM 11219]|uniref:Uncharacterized protein n=1 Tax=Vulcanisaeta souniana JCM 11219 TaxID=1293586 RepID=A0ABM8BM40_9CREN|nr:hypothetical protein Vsou_11300 [Vulcanisaeta souniana JCM 11219]
MRNNSVPSADQEWPPANGLGKASNKPVRKLSSWRELIIFK